MYGGTDSNGLSRRDALKRGAVIAGAVWAVPAVQALQMSSASAEAPSGQGRGRGGGGNDDDGRENGSEE